MLLEDVFAVLLMNELKNLTDVVIGKLGKLVHTVLMTFVYYIKQHNMCWTPLCPRFLCRPTPFIFARAMRH
jgi:hypothetical protein